MRKIIIVLLLILTTTIFQSGTGANTELQEQDSAISKFIVEEYKIVPREADEQYPVKFVKNRKSFFAMLYGIKGKRKKWREAIVSYYHGNEYRIPVINEQLEPFQYKLIENTEPSRRNLSYNFYHNNKLLLKALYEIRCFIVDKKNKLFLFTASQSLENGPPYARGILIVNGEIKHWDSSESGYSCPRLLSNGSLMWLHRNKESYISTYVVMKDSEEIYSFLVKEITEKGVKSFFARGSDWILEYTHHVIINGENIGEKKGYSEMFHYQYIKDMPFYFFKKNDKIGMCYRNEVLPCWYDEVVHCKCCDPSTFNIRGNDNMVWFYALKDGYWYYVEAGIFE